MRGALIVAIVGSCLWAAGARAQDVDAPAASTEIDAPFARETADNLSSDGAARLALARRILRSSIADQLSADAGDPSQAEATVTAWIASHPLDAAHLELGFAEDDRTGRQDFDRSLHERVRRYLELNPHRNQGILGALGAAGRQSRKITKLNQKGESEEEQQERMRRLFEGEGSESSKVLTYGDSRPSGPASAGAGDAVAAPALFDRLTSANLTGYSPLVLALQSALNAQRPAGAPPAPETGRLDYATLVYPAYSLRYDLSRQQAAIAALGARVGGRPLSVATGRPPVSGPDDSPAAARIRASLARRADALARAQAAIDRFQGQAARMRQPSAITRGRMGALAAAQKEASRWLLVASLEGDLERIEDEAGFWTPELARLVAAAPAAPAVRDAYARQARALLERMDQVRALDRSALELLRADDYAARWTSMEQALAAANEARRDVGVRVQLVARVPGALLAAAPELPRWRAMLESAVRRFAPSTAWGRAIDSRERRAAEWARAFACVAAGDFTAALRAVEAASGGVRLPGGTR